MGEGVQKKVNSIFDTAGNELMLKIKKSERNNVKYVTQRYNEKFHKSQLEEFSTVTPGERTVEAEQQGNDGFVTISAELYSSLNHVQIQLGNDKGEIMLPIVMFNLIQF